MDVQLNNETQRFIEALKNRPNVIGIILFGSWARGNNRPASDIDLLVIVSEGFKRAVEYYGRQAFEIIFTTADSAFAFWQANRDDCANLWEVARILYDPDGIVERLKTRALELLASGKPPIDHLEQIMFDTEDQFAYIDSVREHDPTTAAMLLTRKIFTLTGLFFDIRQIWTPAPKQRLAVLDALNPELHHLIERFYSDSLSIGEKCILARTISHIVFKKA